jgi:hypothetical protein
VHPSFVPTAAIVAAIAASTSAAIWLPAMRSKISRFALSIASFADQGASKFFPVDPLGLSCRQSYRIGARKFTSEHKARFQRRYRHFVVPSNLPGALTRRARQRRGAARSVDPMAQQRQFHSRGTCDDMKPRWQRGRINTARRMRSGLGEPGLIFGVRTTF